MQSTEPLFHSMEEAIRKARVMQLEGHVEEVTGMLIRAALPQARIGELCRLEDIEHNQSVLAEVIGFRNDSALLASFGRMDGISLGMRVVPCGSQFSVPVGEALIGRVLDGLGAPLDLAGKGPLPPTEFRPVLANPPSPLERQILQKPFPTGIRAIDGLLTMARGQRMGVFAAAGGGKSTLLAKLAQSACADVVVVALIGERGREVREFIEHTLGEEGMKKTVLLVSTSDRPALERLKAAHAATAIAEYFRDEGRDVLLLMDSVTRFARAQREIGLAAGEPPTRRGFPPSVFSQLPLLLERAGPGTCGSITAFYTVLVEGDDMAEPIADEVRSILDGHILLSRELAASGHYPAIDILGSVSRLMGSITDSTHREKARIFRDRLSRYKDLEMLIQIGEYKPGGDSEADAAVRKMPAMKQFLVQGMQESASTEQTLENLSALAT